MEPVEVTELAARVSERRRHDGLGLRAAAAQAEVPFTTLARVEQGHLPDLANFRRIVEWLGLDPALFFRPSRLRAESTPERIKHSLLRDPHLTEAAAQQIAGLVENLYSALARPDAGVQVHARAHSTFTPTAATALADLVQRMQDRLLADPALGHVPPAGE